jgi:L-aminopeptidase/D-esterase-like protein
MTHDAHLRTPAGRPRARSLGIPFGGTPGDCNAVTDVPGVGQCKALARRVPLGLARTGTTGSHFSGDIFLAFSTANHGQLAPGSSAAGEYRSLRFVPWSSMDPFLEAVVQATEEAVLNALCAAEEMAGVAGRRSPGLPHGRVSELLSARGMPA